MNVSTLEIVADASPFLSFSELLKRAIETVKAPLDVGDPPFEIVRLECNPGPAGANQLLVRFYPSDRFLDFAATILARDLNLSTIKETSHIKPLNNGNPFPVLETSEVKRL